MTAVGYELPIGTLFDDGEIGAETGPQSRFRSLHTQTRTWGVNSWIPASLSHQPRLWAAPRGFLTSESIPASEQRDPIHDVKTIF